MFTPTVLSNPATNPRLGAMTSPLVTRETPQLCKTQGEGTVKRVVSLGRDGGITWPACGLRLQLRDTIQVSLPLTLGPRICTRGC